MRQEFSKQQRIDAIASLKQYFECNMPEPLGDLPAGLLLDFFLQEIGPVLYNGAIADAQARLGLKISKLDGELYEVPFTYWSDKGRTGKRSR